MAENDFTNAAFHTHLHNHKLMGSRCQACKTLYLPPRPMCPNCFGDEMAWEPLQETGTLAAFTTVHIMPTAMLKAGYSRKKPYCAGIVKLDDGPSISAMILGVDAQKPESITIGAPLKATYIERGEGEEAVTYLAFEPA
jgi:uncharacterized OB-fold protein